MVWETVAARGVCVALELKRESAGGDRASDIQCAAAARVVTDIRAAANSIAGIHAAARSIAGIHAASNAAAGTLPPGGAFGLQPCQERQARFYVTA